MRKFIEEPGEMPISKEDFEYMEEKYGVKFPEEFKAFYMVNNGLEIHLCRFKEKYELSSFLPLRGKWSIEYVKDDFDSDEIVPKYMIPFGDDEGGDFYFINLNDGAVYSIRGDSITKHVKIADSFNEFLDMLDNSVIQ